MLFCPDKFTGMLTAPQAAAAMAAGWSGRAPADELTLAPMSAGEAGFVDVVEAALGGSSVGVTVRDPLGRDVPGAILFVEQGGLRTAYVEAAAASGLHLLDAAERDPCVTTSYGVGQMMLAALEEGAGRIVVATGGVGSHDGGAGMLAALGVGAECVLARGGGVLHQLTAADLAGLPHLCERFAGVELIAATESSLPLLGFSGTSATVSPEMGASPESAQHLERCLGHLVDVVEKVSPPPADLLTGAPIRLERQPGAGAGGGIGYAVHVLGGRTQPAADIVMNAWRMDDLLAHQDLVITGETNFSGRSVHGGVVLEVAMAAMRHALPTVVLAGEVTVGRRESMAAGISAVYPVAERGEDLEIIMQDPSGTLSARAARLAGTWSR